MRDELLNRKDDLLILISAYEKVVAEECSTYRDAKMKGTLPKYP
jgi:hypothetical protein